MNWISNITKFLPESTRARQAREERMKVAVRKHVEDGKVSLHSSWTSSGFGLADFQMALDVQRKLYGEADHPEQISTMICIAKALQKQNDYEGSLNILKCAFRIQLQHVGLYESATVTILDTMIAVVSSIGTPHALSQAQSFANTLHRIKYRLYGRTESFFVSASSNSVLKDSIGTESSILVEMEGDHVLLEDKKSAVAKYREAALMEYKRWGSCNLNFALLHRKVAILSLEEKTRAHGDDPFELLLRPKCQTEECRAIRRADELLFKNYEKAAGIYMKTTSPHVSSQPQGIILVLSALIMIFLIIIAAYGPKFFRRLLEWVWLDCKGKESLPPCSSSNSSKPEVVKVEQGASIDQRQTEQTAGGNVTMVALPGDHCSSGESLTGSEATIISPQDQPTSSDDENVFARSFERFGTSFMDREIERVKAGHLDSTILADSKLE